MKTIAVVIIWKVSSSKCPSSILVGYLLRVAFDNNNVNNNDHTNNKDTKNNDKTDKNDHITIILKILIIEILSNR